MFMEVVILNRMVRKCLDEKRHLSKGMKGMRASAMEKAGGKVS